MIKIYVKYTYIISYSGLTSNNSNISVEVPILCTKSNMNIHYTVFQASKQMQMANIKCSYLNKTLEK